MLNRRLFLFLLIPLLLLTGCDIDIGLPTTTLTPLPTPASTATAVSQAVATATTAPQATNTRVVATVAPTQPRATATSAVTATSNTDRNQAAGPTVTLPPGEIVPTPLPASPTPAVSSAIATCSADDDLPASRSSLGDAYFPTLGNSGYDSLHYSLDLSVDMDSNTISGTTTMLALATADLPGFNLDLNGMDVAAVLVNGQPAQFSRAESELEITPASPIAAGQQFTSVVSYSGVPSPGMEGGAPLEGGWNAYNNGVWVFNEPASAHTWYPVNDHPCDKATYDVRVDVPQPYIVAANGLLKNVEQQGDRNIYYWASRDPIASYLVTIDIEKFTVQNLVGPNGLPMRNYFPSFEAVRLEDTFGRMPEMIALFNEKFGPYPFEAYGVMVAGTNLGFAGEAQTISVFGLNTGQRGNADETIAHELAHQWFGDSVSLKTWKDEWLKEGFATFAQWVWLEHVSNKDEVDQRMRQTYQSLSVDKPSPPADPAPDDLYNSGVYLRGGMTLMAIRHRVGDDTFFRILQTYTERYRYGNASTQDFINVAKEVSGEDLDALFDAWLHNPDLPPLTDVVDN